MTETTFASPRLERPHSRLAGVCAALARTTGTDVVLWRVLFVVLIFFGGLGVALYLACWVAIPAEGEEDSLVSRLLHGPDRRVSTGQVLLLGLVLVAAVSAFHDNGGWLVAVGLGGLGYLWWRRRQPAADAIPPSSAPAPAPARVDAASPPPPPVWQAPVPRQRSVLTALTLSTASLVVGVLLLLSAAGTASLATEVVLASALGVVGLGLVASAWWGRARGLVPVAVLLALALGGTAGARPVIDHGVGERDWTAQAAGDYRLGVGDATLSLGTLLAQGTVTQEVTARVSVGSLEVVVPDGVRAVVEVRVQTGEIQLDGTEYNGRAVHRTFVFGPEGPPQVHVDARVGAGLVEVRRA